MPLLAQGTVDLIQSGGNPLIFFYTDLADVCSRCSDAIQPIAFVLIFASLLIHSYKCMMGSDLSGIIRHIVVSGVIISIMPFYAEWMLAAQSALGSDLLTDLEVDPLSTLINFGESFADGPWDEPSAPDIILGVLDPIEWASYFCQIIGMFFMIVISMVMYALFWCGFQIQIIALYLGSAVGPMFLAMLVFEQTRDTAVKYHIGMISICFWPLGWGIGMLFTEALMTGAIPQASVVVTFIFGPLAAVPIVNQILAIGAVVIILLIIIVWLIVVLFAAPKIVSKAITTGAQIGMGLVSAGASTASGVATAGVQAASGAAMMAGGAALTASGVGSGAGIGMMTAGAGSMGGGASSMGKAVSSAGS